MGIIWVLLLVLGCHSAFAQPAQIILIRHAEKPVDPNDIHLTLKGRERAMALVPFLTEKPEFLTNGLPVALFATAKYKQDQSARTQETLAPLAKQLNVPIQANFRNRDYEALAQYILSNRAFQGKTVLICWVHEFIPELAAALGVTTEPRKKWKAKEFDRVYLITYQNNLAVLNDMPQRLLYGDSDR